MACHSTNSAQQKAVQYSNETINISNNRLYVTDTVQYSIIVKSQGQEWHAYYFLAIHWPRFPDRLRSNWCIYLITAGLGTTSRIKDNTSYNLEMKE